MSKRPLALRIASRQYAFVREVNDIHIFVNQAVPLLEEAKGPFATSTRRKDRRYYVPSIKRIKFAKRSDQELRGIYERFTNHALYELYETFLVSVVSKFEAFMAEVMKEVLLDYPQKIGVSVPGLKATKEVPTEVLFTVETLEGAIEEVIDRHIAKVFFTPPKIQFSYLSEIVGTKTNDEAFAKYVELKATRDLLVHNTGIANEIYVQKTGRYARAEVGGRIDVDRIYFDRSLALVKRLSGIIERDAGSHFPKQKSAKSN